MCRSRRELSNADLLAKFGFDTASLPRSRALGTPGSSMSSSAPPVGTWRAHTSHITHRTPRAFGPSRRWEGARKREQAPTFTLWGITLGITSDLLCLAGRGSLDEPPVYLHNAALRAAYQLQLLGPLSRSGKRRSRL